VAEASFARSSSVKGPTGVDATPMLSDRVDVVWTNAAAKQDDVRVERSTDGGATWGTASVLPGNAVALVDEGRTPEQRVCYRVIAVSAKIESAPSSSDCTSPPAIPTGLSAAVVDVHTVDLSWTDRSGVEDGYYLTRWSGSNRSGETRIAELPANSTQYRDGSIPSAGAYTYRVRAKKDGGLGTPSDTTMAYVNVAPPPPPPNAPSALNAVAIGSVVASVTWTDNAADEEGFRVQRGPTSDGPWTTTVIYGANATAWSDQAAPEQSLCYRVIAFNKNGDSSPSNVDCAAYVFRPMNLAAQQIDDHTIDLSWTSSSALATTTEIERGPTNSGPFIVIATVPATARTYRDAGATPNTTYWYVVRNRRQDDVSDSYTMTAASTATAPPAPVSDLAAYPGSSTVIYVWWTDNATNESGFRVEKSSDGGSTWVSAGSELPDQRIFSDWNAVTELRMCYRVTAYNSAGDAPPSNIACTAPPAAATELSARKIDATTVELTWRDNSNVEDGYDILRSTGGFIDEMEVVGHVDANVTTFRDTTFPAGWFADYRVQPRKDGGWGDWGDYTEISDDPLIWTMTGKRTARPRQPLLAAPRAKMPIRHAPPSRRP
jgi:hypothetical protein